MEVRDCLRDMHHRQRWERDVNMLMMSARKAGGPPLTAPEAQTSLQQENKNAVPRRTG